MSIIRNTNPCIDLYRFSWYISISSLFDVIKITPITLLAGHALDNGCDKGEPILELYLIYLYCHSNCKWDMIEMLFIANDTISFFFNYYFFSLHTYHAMTFKCVLYTFIFTIPSLFHHNYDRTIINAQTATKYDQNLSAVTHLTIIFFLIHIMNSPL